MSRQRRRAMPTADGELPPRAMITEYVKVSLSMPPPTNSRRQAFYFLGDEAAAARTSM